MKHNWKIQILLCWIVCLTSGWMLFLGSVSARADEDGEFPAGSPVVAQDANGHLEVFRMDAQGELFHKSQKDDYGNWGPWVSLGGWLLPQFAVARDRSGRLMVFAVDKMSKILRYKWEADTNHLDLDWTTWNTVGQDATFRPPPVVGRNLDGRLDVFCLDAGSGIVRHIWQTGADGGWSKWTDLGGQVKPGFVVGRNRDGRLELFGIDASSGDLIHCCETAPNADQSWSAWSDLKGSVLPGLSVDSLADGRLQIFGVNSTNNQVDYVYQLSPSATNQWSVWRSLGGNVKPGFAVGQRVNGCLEVFAINAKDATMVCSHQTKPVNPDEWSGWKNEGGSLRPNLAVGRNQDGNLEVFAEDKNNVAVLKHRRQISNNTGWLDWLNMDEPIFRYASRTWQMADGLPYNDVQAITQTPDGYLWVGTRVGLARFDGINFKSFTTANTPEIESDSISALFVDQIGGLWIGTHGGGVTLLKNGRFSHFGQTDGLAGNDVNVISGGTDGSVWIGTTEGMSRYENGQFKNFTRKDGLLSNLVRSLCVDHEGNLWIATDQGVDFWKKDGQKISFTTANGLPSDSVRTIYADSGGRTWIGTDDGVTFYSGGRFYSYTTQYGLADRVVSAIFKDHLGNLWIGTYGGLNRFRGGRFLNELDDDGLPYGQVNTIFEDWEGNLWVGSRDGLIRFTPKHFFLYTKRQGLTGNNIASVMEDRVRNLWIGTWGGGLDKLRGDAVTAFQDYTNSYVLSLCESYNGVWIGADFGERLAKFSNGRFKYYNWKDGLPKAGIKVMHEDRQHRLWIGTSKGLSLFQDGRFTNYTVRDGLAGNDVRAICEDSKGNLWIGTDGGLSRWQDGKFANLTVSNGLSDNSVTAIYSDDQNELWIGTESGGLDRYQHDKFTVYTTRQGLFSDEIFDIIEDDYGWLWMSCSKGIFRVRKKDFDDLDAHQASAVTSIAYGKADGLESAQCNGIAKPGVWKAWDGKLWFATTKGLVGVDPKINIDTTPPPVFIEELSADNRAIWLGGLGNESRTAGTLIKPDDVSESDAPIRIPPGRGELVFRYTALNFQTPEKTRFKYKLEGVDLNWVSAGRRRVARYYNVYPGRYRFDVIACNSDGVWNKIGASMNVVVLPHFWQTWWFISLMGLAGISGIVATVRQYEKRKSQLALERLEQQHLLERERSRIAKDIHDDLGASLTRMAFLSELIKTDETKQDIDAHAGKIAIAARETVCTLDEIVWAVNPRSDTLDSLLQYLSHYANRFLEETPINCRLDIPIDISPITVTAEVRHNLFLMVKEALNNAVKHSEATEVRVRVVLRDQTVRIEISDNGRGFAATDALQKKRSGLGNMRQRLEAIGGSLILESRPGLGTTVVGQVLLETQPRRNN